MAELCDHQMKRNQAQHQHKHRHIYHENDFQNRFNFNTRVKLPPITPEIPLFTKAGVAKAANVNSAPGQTEISVSLPQILGPSSVYKPRSDIVVNEQLEQQFNSGATNKCNHIDRVPLNFPKAYTVLPPINSHKQKPPPGYNSNKQPNWLNGKQIVALGQTNSSIEAVIGNGVNKTGLSQVRARNIGHKKTQPGSLSDGSSKQSRMNKEITNIKENINQRQPGKHTVPTSKLSSPFNGEYVPEDLPSRENITAFSEKKIEQNEIFLHGFDDGRHILQQLEIHEDLKNFLDSKFNKRRGAVCVELDSSLVTAADYIRDILLRQTMEELCMMW